MKKLTYKQVIAIITSLSYSQGFYGRLLNSIYSLNPDELSDFKKTISKAKLYRPLDVVLFFEC